MIQGFESAEGGKGSRGEGKGKRKTKKGKNVKAGRLS